MKNTIQQLFDVGQSIWCDNLSRRMIESTDAANPTGSLRRMMELGVVGITSNPTIFMKSITSSSDYDQRFCELSGRGLNRMAIYEGLVLPDIADAADLLRTTYDRTKGIDGYVSLEVNPHLAYDTQGTVAEARRLFAELRRPNVFIKVPATAEGIPAIETLIGEGINVNVTLIFALEMYERVMRAYLGGLRHLAAAGGDLGKVASVASFFVSRVDSLVDKQLGQRQAQGADVAGLAGRAAVANAKLAYARFEQVFDRKGEFGDLARRGARVQRPLWASTSTKNPAYRDTMYVDDLVGPNTVNTLPPETIAAVLDHGVAKVAVREQVVEAGKIMERLKGVGIDLRAVTDQLLVEGVKAFAQSFDDLFANLARKEKQLRPVG